MATDPSAGQDLCALRDGIYADDLVLAAVGWLDVFTWLVEHPVDLGNLCQGLDLSPRPADVMCTLFRAMGLLEPGEAVLRPTPVARDYLVAGSLFDLRPYYASLRERPSCRELLKVLKTGVPAGWSSSEGGADWAGKLTDAAFARDFTAAMDARAKLLAPALARAVATFPVAAFSTSPAGRACTPALWSTLVPTSGPRW